MKFCHSCQLHVSKSKYSSHKKSNKHKTNCLLRTEYQNVQLIASAFKDRIASYKINPQNNEIITPELFLSDVFNTIYNLLQPLLQKHKSLKINFELFVLYLLPKNEELSLKSFNTKYSIINQSTDIISLYKDCTQRLVCKCLEFELSESGWTIEKISHLEMNIAKYNPLRAGSYIALPLRINKMKACLNIQNTDNHCFLWCIIAHMYPAKNNPNRVSSYPHYSKILNTNGMSFPPTFEDIKWFEKHNFNISVNIYGLEKNNTITGPLYKTKLRKLNHVNLLFISKNGKNHFCLIKNLEKIVRSQLTKHKSRIHLCEECFLYFKTQEKLNNHNCGRLQTILPEENSKLSFSNYQKTQRVPIVIYGDFESLLREYSDKSKSQYIENIQIHEATCFAYYICCESNPELNNLISYRGPNCSKKFVESIINDSQSLYQILSMHRQMLPLTSEEYHSFKTAVKCHICKKKFASDDHIVRDHDHFTGKYRGPAHNKCNLNSKSCHFIPVIFHNLSGYDSHLFINEISSVCGYINLIPKNKEKYISFSKFVPLDSKNTVQLKFIDSFNFLSSSLDNLAKTLNVADFKHLKSFFIDEDLLRLCLKKGVYCYEYINSWKKYEETQLPDRNKFYSRLTSETVSEEDYNHALTVWNKFRINNIGEYTDLYLKCDVLLLCDIFEKFRSMSLKHYGLDPCHYVSSPSLSWDAMLLITQVELDLLSDIEMYEMLEKGVRGGLAQCSLRYAKANNKYLPNYNEQEPNTFLAYLDCVNLYGYAMMQSLPVGNFRFLTNSEIIKFNINSISSDSDEGYILEVDIHYPFVIHDEHSDLPFAAEKIIPPMPCSSKTNKLIANLYDKYKYVIHYIHLQECIKNGIVVLKIHRILSFTQKKILEPYINLNTRLRQEATSDFERDFFKKQNNSIFGKTIENKRKQVDVKLVNLWKDDFNKTNKINGAEKFIGAPNFKNLAIISENLVAIQLQPAKVVLDRPIYMGFTILELAKSHLYNFHYSIMKKIYKNNIKLCYTDTDSLLYLIRTKDFYEDMKNNIQYFDTSNFKINNIYGIPHCNKQIPGFFKDEMGGDVISEFIGLRAKLYCINTLSDIVKKAKGVKKSVSKKITINKYKSALNCNINFRYPMFVIRSKNHKLYTQRINKVVLDGNDDKRQIKKNNAFTLPWGHYSSLF
ncbi:uncharacterized protein LOC124633507 [Helicoverpa zea]|uniref:uncharacterized protein LOC124633507 n=1 Tax=Helicoverpa zea TaxID=7113 RepID=UPI001F55BB3D|nr:uncharacterized protein LOC124633507 [Helicoverpa zea]